MPGFWYPYLDFADATIGPHAGISFSDGNRISVVRRPSGGGADCRILWLNVLAQHVALPPPPTPPATGIRGKLAAWFWRAMEIEGEAEIQSAQAQLAASQALEQGLYDRAWEPAHKFLIRHKLAADTAGVVLDAVGVAAGIVFFVVAAPELIAAGPVMAAAGLITGTAAAMGAFVLFAVDGRIYVAEISGDEATAARLENNQQVQWVRIGATLMLLPDLAVGSLRSLTEVGKLGNEAREASAGSAEAMRSAATARARVAKIRHPERHLGPVSRRMRKVRVFEREAKAQSQAVSDANSRIRTIKIRDLYLFQGTTLAGSALMTAAPPAAAESIEQRQLDEEYEKTLIPKGGMPNDVRIEMRVVGVSSPRSP